MKIRKIITLATAGTAAASLSLFGFGITAANAALTADQDVTFAVESSGVLAISQVSPTAQALTAGTAANLAPTTVSDGRNDVRDWTVSAHSSALVQAPFPDIAIDSVAFAVAGTPAAAFASGDSGTVDGTPVAPVIVSVSGDTIDSAYTYTPTATLSSSLGNIAAGDYTGTVTQTVV